MKTVRTKFGYTVKTGAMRCTGTKGFKNPIIKTGGDKSENKVAFR